MFGHGEKQKMLKNDLPFANWISRIVLNVFKSFFLNSQLCCCFEAKFTRI